MLICQKKTNFPSDLIKPSKPARLVILPYSVMPIHHLEVTKTARYCTYGEASEDTQNLWLVCHGYGQLAEYFIKKFEGLDPQTNLVVAPEALSHFYHGQFTGKVGATWMTKHDRVHEIRDYLGYLNKVYATVIKPPQLLPSQLRIIILGFSQGTATVSRWVCDGHVKFDDLVIWAGGLAHDLDFEAVPEILKNKKVHFVYGKQDELIKEEHFQEQLQKIHELGIQPNIIPFEGKHELNAEIIKQIEEGVS